MDPEASLEVLNLNENKEELDLLFDAGEIYYVEQIPKMGAIKARNRLEILNKTEGIEKLGNCKLAKEFVVQ